MKLNKNISLWTLTALTTIAIPIATVVSCGDSDNGDSDNIDSFDITEKRWKEPKFQDSFEKFMAEHVDKTRKKISKDFQIVVDGKEFKFTKDMSKDEVEKTFKEYNDKMNTIVGARNSNF